ncbi:MAG: hypothetical protein ACM3PY_09390 [Omnitrophica WOR_2 bacterium]
MNHKFLQRLDADQRELLLSLDSPRKIQDFLDRIPYNIEETNFSPLRVMQEQRAHCVEGALFAAAALRQIGYAPILLDMLPDPGMDDDHVLAVYRQNGAYGAIAKSNYWCLRYREAVYRSLRELVMSYYELFFNVHGLKELRAYTVPLHVDKLDHLEWMWDDKGAAEVYQRLLNLRKITVTTPAQIASLSLMDPAAYEACMSGVNPDGLFKGLKWDKEHYARPGKDEGSGG